MGQEKEQNQVCGQKVSMEAILTLIGSILIRISNGIVLIWGSTNLYYLSYLKNEGVHITSSTNSHLLLASTIPIAVLTLLATKLSNRFGYEFMVRLCAFVFLISPLIINYLKGVVAFTIFYMILPGAAFTVSTIPLLNIMITQFPRYRTRVNSLMVICIGVSTFGTNCIFSILVNPNNQQPQAINGFSYFSQSVSSNVLKVNNIITITCGILFVVGSMMIKQKSKLCLSPPISIQEDILTQKLGVNLQENIQVANIPVEAQPKIPFLASILSTPFLCLFSIALLNGLFPNYTTSYFKIIFMSVIEDDCVLTCLLATYSLTNIIGALFWGWIADRWGVVKGLLLLVSLDILLKLVSFQLQNKIVLFVFVPLAGLLDKGTLTMISPGLVELFGISRGTELMPIRQLSTVLSFSILPIAQLLTKNFVTFYGLLRIIAVINIFTIVPTIVLYVSERKKKVAGECPPKILVKQVLCFN